MALPTKSERVVIGTAAILQAVQTELEAQQGRTKRSRDESATQREHSD